MAGAVADKNACHPIGGGMGAGAVGSGA